MVIRSLPISCSTTALAASSGATPLTAKRSNASSKHARAMSSRAAWPATAWGLRSGRYGLGRPDARTTKIQRAALGDGPALFAAPMALHPPPTSGLATTGARSISCSPSPMFSRAITAGALSNPMPGLSAWGSGRRRSERKGDPHQRAQSNQA